MDKVSQNLIKLFRHNDQLRKYLLEVEIDNENIKPFVKVVSYYSSQFFDHHPQSKILGISFTPNKYLSTNPKRIKLPGFMIIVERTGSVRAETYYKTIYQISAKSLSSICKHSSTILDKKIQKLLTEIKSVVKDAINKQHYYNKEKLRIVLMSTKNSIEYNVTPKLQQYYKEISKDIDKIKEQCANEMLSRYNNKYFFNEDTIISVSGNTLYTFSVKTGRSEKKTLRPLKSLYKKVIKRHLRQQIFESSKYFTISRKNAKKIIAMNIKRSKKLSKSLLVKDLTDSINLTEQLRDMLRTIPDRSRFQIEYTNDSGSNGIGLIIKLKIITDFGGEFYFKDGNSILYYENAFSKGKLLYRLEA